MHQCEPAAQTSGLHSVPETWAAFRTADQVAEQESGRHSLQKLGAIRTQKLGRNPSMKLGPLQGWSAVLYPQVGPPFVPAGAISEPISNRFLGQEAWVHLRQDLYLIILICGFVVGPLSILPGRAIYMFPIPFPTRNACLHAVTRFVAPSSATTAPFWARRHTRSSCRFVAFGECALRPRCRTL